MAHAFGALLVPAALMAYVMGLWRVASDMSVASPFPMTGLFSHWQVWIVVGVMLHLASSSFSRYGRGGDFRMPRFLSFRSPKAM